MSINAAYKYDPVKNDRSQYDLNKYRNLDVKVNEETRGEVINIQRKNADKTSTLKIALGAVLAMVLLFCVIYSKVQVSDMYNKINSQKSELANLENESARLNVSIESYASLENIESHAEDVGLKKIDKAQIWYIDLGEDDVVRISEVDENIFVKIKKMFSSFSEYFS